MDKIFNGRRGWLFLAAVLVAGSIAFVTLREGEGDVSSPKPTAKPSVSSIAAEGLQPPTDAGLSSVSGLDPLAKKVSPPRTGEMSSGPANVANEAVRPKLPPTVVASFPSPNGSTIPLPSNDSPRSAEDEDHAAVDALTLCLRDFRTVMGENPVGTNEEITKALDGANRKQSRLLPENARMNNKGELIDGWGVPYFFHQISKSDMEIRSAGPDLRMWTSDDLVAH